MLEVQMKIYYYKIVLYQLAQQIILSYIDNKKIMLEAK